MPLTPEEKACGRAFRDWGRDALLNGITADAFCPPYITWYRHECMPSDKAVQSGTWAMWLKQTYVLSAECDGFAPGPDGYRPFTVPAGLFAYIYRFGECPRCGLRVRSGTGRFVLASGNPPEKGAHVAQQPAHGGVPACQAGHAQSPSVG